MANEDRIQVKPSTISIIVGMVMMLLAVGALIYQAGVLNAQIRQNSVDITRNSVAIEQVRTNLQGLDKSTGELRTLVANLERLTTKLEARLDR